jgi:hypothetical protein
MPGGQRGQSPALLTSVDRDAARETQRRLQAVGERGANGRLVEGNTHLDRISAQVRGRRARSCIGAEEETDTA